MPNVDPDDLTARLRAANVAPEADESFISQLAMSAASSAPAESGDRRRPRTLTMRVAAVVLGATLVVSGGAMASALWLKGSDPAPAGPGRAPADPTPSVRSDAPSSGGSDSGSTDGTEAEGAPGPTAPDRRDHQPKGHGNPNGNANGHADGHGGAHQPNGNGNGNANGHADGHGGAHQPNGNANGHADSHGGAHQPNGNGNGGGNGNANGHDKRQSGDPSRG